MNKIVKRLVLSELAKTNGGQETPKNQSHVKLVSLIQHPVKKGIDFRALMMQ